MAFNIINPEKEFLVVRHSYLNGNALDLEDAVEKTLALEEHTAGREVVPGFEGDLLQVEETGEIVLTHRNFISLPEKRYQEFREKGIATSLDEALKRIAEYKQAYPDQRIVVCLEPKAITTDATLYQTVEDLKKCGFTNQEAYFDSFFGGKLDVVREANGSYGTNYPVSLHLAMNIFSKQVNVIKPKEKPDVVTIPTPMGFGHPQVPVIYGALGNLEKLKEMAQDPLVIGAYPRSDKNTAEMLFDSVTNTSKMRKFYTISV